MAGRNVNLTDYLAAFVDEQVHNGRHQNASEVVREALRRYEGDVAIENERIAAVRALIQESREAISHGAFSLIATPQDQQALLSRLTRRGTKPGKG
jgi:antitoxin ParD1/3/4